MNISETAYYITWHDIYIQQKGISMYSMELDGAFGVVSESRKDEIADAIKKLEIQLQANHDFFDLVKDGRDIDITFEILETQLKSHCKGEIYHVEFENKLYRFKNEVTISQ